MIDKDRANRALRRTLIGLLVALGLVAVPASAAVYEGHADDPTGDSVLSPGYGGETYRGMDLTGLTVGLDSASHELRITFAGNPFPMLAHQATHVSAVISPEACGAPTSPVTRIEFTGTIHQDTRLSSGHLSGRVGLEGAVEAPTDGVVSFVFSGLDGVDFSLYRCVYDVQATWIDSGNARSVDGIAPFCLGTGCLGPPAPPGSPQVVVVPQPVVVTVQGARIEPRCSILPGKIKTTTARMRFLQRASHKGSEAHRKAVTRQVRVLASRRTTQRATFKALCT